MLQRTVIKSVRSCLYVLYTYLNLHSSVCTCVCVCNLILYVRKERALLLAHASDVSISFQPHTT